MIQLAQAAAILAAWVLIIIVTESCDGYQTWSHGFQYGKMPFAISSDDVVD